MPKSENASLSNLRYLGFFFQLLGIFLILGQYGSHWFEFANDFTSRSYVIICFAFASLGNALLVFDGSRVMNAFVTGVISFVILLGVMGTMGFVGLMDASNPDLTQAYQVSGGGFLYGLDGLSGSIVEISFLLKTIAQLIPTIVLIIGIITILISDSPDEYMTALIEIGIAIALLVVFYFFGNYFGFT